MSELLLVPEMDTRLIRNFLRYVRKPSFQLLLDGAVSLARDIPRVEKGDVYILERGIGCR